MSCRAQAASFETIHKDLVKAGTDHAWVGLHAPSAQALRHQRQIDRATTYPLLQETEAKWLRNHYGKNSRHDAFVFDKDGALVKHFEGRNSRPFTVDELDALKAAIPTN